MSAALAIARADQLACKSWIRHHSKSFFLSSLLLPPRVRQAAWALYAFCRRADDAVDVEDRSERKRRNVVELRRRLEAVYRGTPQDDPIDRSFQYVVERYRIPRGVPEALLAGMEMDAEKSRYQNWEELYLYCFRVASTVGLMMTCIMGPSAEIAFVRAADLGIAMQLTNIARDVGEDFERGRIYLPRVLLDEVGYAGAAIAPSRALAEAVRRLLLRADQHYRAADAGVPLLPRGCRLAIASSRQIYCAIGAAIAKNGYDSVSRRAYVPLAKKLLLVARGVPALLRRKSENTSGPADALLMPWLRDVGLPVAHA